MGGGRHVDQVLPLAVAWESREAMACPGVLFLECWRVVGGSLVLSSCQNRVGWDGVGKGIMSGSGALLPALPGRPG